MPEGLVGLTSYPFERMTEESPSMIILNLNQAL
jgi:hypothetical protein